MLKFLSLKNGSLMKAMEFSPLCLMCSATAELSKADINGSSPVSIPASYSFEMARSCLLSQKMKYLPAVNDDGLVVDLMTRDDVKRMRDFPVLGVASIGKDGTVLVGAAIGTRQSGRERLELPVKAGVNVVVLDSSQGDSIYQREVIGFVKRTYRGLDLVVGNVVTAYQAQNLIKYGADSLRVSMGSGSICTNQEVYAVGRGHRCGRNN